MKQLSTLYVTAVAGILAILVTAVLVYSSMKQAMPVAQTIEEIHEAHTKQCFYLARFYALSQILEKGWPEGGDLDDASINFLSMLKSCPGDIVAKEMADTLAADAASKVRADWNAKSGDH